MNHNDIVRQSFKKQAEKFVAYHMSKVDPDEDILSESVPGQPLCSKWFPDFSNICPP